MKQELDLAASEPRAHQQSYNMTNQTWLPLNYLPQIEQILGQEGMIYMLFNISATQEIKRKKICKKIVM